MITLETQWRLVSGLLRQARSELGPSAANGSRPADADIPTDALNQFELFLENNELGLAWDTLAAIADDVNAPRSFWEKLLVAAGLMSSAEHAHAAATRLCADQLSEKRVS